MNTDAAALRPRLLQLRALRVVDVEGWARYVAGDLGTDRHILQLGDGSARHLTHGEAWWWALGLADGYGHGHLIARLEQEQQPGLLTVVEAASHLPQGQRGGDSMTLKGMEHLIRVGQLYTIYGPGHVRWVFAAQVQAIAAARYADRDPTDQHLRDTARAAQSAWAAIRSQYPPAVRVVDLAENPSPTPSPEPLPIPAAYKAPQRQLHALMVAHNEGWITYHRPASEGEARGYVVTVTGVGVGGVVGPIQRLIPPAGVLPWVLGVADYRGQSKVVAYRDGLG